MTTSHVLPQAALVLAAVAIVLLAAAAMGRLGGWLSQPPAVAEMITGIVLGPSVLGQLPGNLPGRIFTPATLPLLSGIAQVGLVLFMFLAGWELDLAILRGPGSGRWRWRAPHSATLRPGASSSWWWRWLRAAAPTGSSGSSR